MGPTVPATIDRAREEAIAALQHGAAFAVTTAQRLRLVLALGALNLLLVTTGLVASVAGGTGLTH